MLAAIAAGLRLIKRIITAITAKYNTLKDYSYCYYRLQTASKHIAKDSMHIHTLKDSSLLARAIITAIAVVAIVITIVIIT